MRKHEQYGLERSRVCRLPTSPGAAVSRDTAEATLLTEIRKLAARMDGVYTTPMMRGAQSPGFLTWCFVMASMCS